MKKNIKLILTIAIILGLSPSVFAASMSIQSSLPAPVGNVKLMKMLNNAFADGDTCNPGEVGLLNYTLYICGASGVWSTTSPAASVWTQSGNNVYLTDSSNQSSKRVAIGTQTPVWKLTLDNDGAIFARGTFASGDIPSAGATSDPGTRFMWIPRRGAIRAGTVSAAQWVNSSIGDYSAAFGRDNKAATESSVVSGGYNNSINANGGAAFDGYAVIGGGRTNSSSSNDTVIGGGNTNSISTGAQYSVVSGGFTNVINTNVTGGTISGGWNNTVSGAGDTIGGGYVNTVNGGLSGASTIAGGYNNTIASGPTGKSTIGGGNTNSITGPYNVIAGGDQNSLSTGVIGWSTIGGGALNSIGGTKPSRAYSTIAGGRQNSLDGQYSSITGGTTNSIAADSASILGGNSNSTSGDYSAIVGGLSNSANASAWGAFIGGGTLNQANFSGTVIGGGESNIASGQYSTIGGGFTNTASGFAAAIPGGVSNTASGNYSAVLGGGSNGVTNAYSVVGGYNLNNTAQHSFLWGYNPPGPVFPWNINDSALFYISGNFGIGQGTYASNPAYKLSVDGTLGVNGNLVTVGNITSGGTLTVTTMPKVSGTPGATPPWWSASTHLFGFDVAELFDAKEEVETADLVEVSDDPGVLLQKTQKPYSTRVVGVVSTAPAILFEGNELKIAPKPGEFTKGKKPPVALAGRVPVKVCLENGPIARGDLLVSSSLPGHVMKATDRDKMMGAVVGKALEPFDPGKDEKQTGTVLMIVNLQ